MMGAGNPQMKDGLSISQFSFQKGMHENRTAFYSADGDLLFVPQTGVMLVTSEFGRLRVKPTEIIVIPRGVKFSIDIEGKENVRGWLTELYKGHFLIPDLGPIGSNGLANERDFSAPVAAYENTKNQTWKVVAKFMGNMFEYEQDHSPFDVVAWHGNYYPYKYDLNRFNTMGSISFDHPDPSIFTVLTAQSDDPGQAVLDFVIFPPRWLVAENTFRPPYYHRNTMSEFMGNIKGTYDAKEKGFIPGASSLHSTMSGHGPESEVFKKASEAELKPQLISPDSLAFMFETCFMMKLTDYAMNLEKDEEYGECWNDLPNQF
jgi:homogentisate 1,2-dioxygenase